MARRSRRRAFAYTLACVGTLFVAVSATDCADPTEIVITVTSDACPPGKNGMMINATGIAVGTATTIDDARDSAVRDKCEAKDLVGTLTLYPSGDKDAEVTFRVVSGVLVPLDQCKANGFKGCITQHRTLRFVPRKSQPVSVSMSLTCLGVGCPAGQTCENGACVSDRVVGPPAEGGTPDATIGPDGGPVVDATSDVVDAKGDASRGCDPAKCTGGAAKGCDVAANVCVIDCNADGGPPKCLSGTNVCPNDQDCRVLCGGAGICNDIRCNTIGTCTLECSAANSCQGDLQCNASRCIVHCANDGTCTNVKTTGENASFTCVSAGGGNKACDNVACKSNACTMSCSGNGCSGDQRCCSPKSQDCAGSWKTKDPTACN